MFSRPIQPEFININSIENAFIENANFTNFFDVTPKSIPENILKSNDYFKNKTILDNYKIADLKEIIKYYKSTVNFSRDDKYSVIQMKNVKTIYDFSLSGKKEDLSNRIKDYFKKDNSVLKIQTLFRGYLVKLELFLRGPALKNRSLCVNDTDFYTLESLKEIPLDAFFSYIGEGDFVYGFDLNSVSSLIKNSRNDKLINPYNRESMQHIILNVLRLSRINGINRKTKSRLANKDDQSSFRSRINGNAYNAEAALDELRKAKAKPLNQRINDLFIEIDQLGNYTQSGWFSDLTRQEMIRYFRCIYDIWNYRAQLSFDTKRKICPLFDPFGNTLFSLSQLLTMTDDQLRMLCLSVMEQMILTGIDKDHKMIGTFHILTALTVVSSNARTNLPWLFESLGF
jgi:hypothetical protein